MEDAVKVHVQGVGVSVDDDGEVMPAFIGPGDVPVACGDVGAVTDFEIIIAIGVII